MAAAEVRVASGIGSLCLPAGHGAQGQPAQNAPEAQCCTAPKARDLHQTLQKDCVMYTMQAWSLP